MSRPKIGTFLKEFIIVNAILFGAYLAITTVEPVDNPKNKLTSKNIIGLDEPIDATALDDTEGSVNWPTTIISAALNASWSKLVKINGIEKRKRLRGIDPLVISSKLDFLVATLLIINLTLYFTLIKNKSQLNNKILFVKVNFKKLKNIF